MSELSFQVAWAVEKDLIDVEVDVDIVKYGRRATWDMPAERGEVKIVRVYEKGYTEDGRTVEIDWKLDQLPAGFAELVDDLAADACREEAREADMAWQYAEPNGVAFRDSDYWA